MNTPAPTPLAIDDLRRRRAGSRFGAVIHGFDTIESTNSMAQAEARGGAPEGTVVVAETQTRGRGRLGRSWVSPPGRNLYLSLVLRPAVPPAQAPLLALVAGLATADAAREWAPTATLKWPNDVLVDGRKLAGILTEMDADDDRVRFVIVGIGVNVNALAGDFPPELAGKATSLAMVTGAPVDRVAFTDRLLTHLEARCATFARAGFAALRADWETHSAMRGRRVEIDAGDRIYAGTVLGVADDGTLRLRTDDGREESVVAGDVTVVDGYART